MDTCDRAGRLAPRTALLACMIAGCGMPFTKGAPADPVAATFRLGEPIVLNGMTFHVAAKGDGQLLLSLPRPPTASLGAFITPRSAWASSSQESAARTPGKLIDGSGWGETWPRSGVFVHTNNVYEGGGNMWNGAPDAELLFDLGRVYTLNGMYVWNYNEAGEWRTRSVKDVAVSVSQDGETFEPVGTFTLMQAPGTPAGPAEAVEFPRPVKARAVRFKILTNYRGGEMSGLSEIRFSDADRAAETRHAPAPRYPRPAHPAIPLGSVLEGSENVAYPEDAGIVDVTRPPYGAKGDGKTDDTAAIQRALDDHPNLGAILYLPNGRYLVSDTLRWPHGKSGGAEEKRTILQGQSREGAVILLRDRCPGFEDPRHPKAVIWTGERPAQRFGNEIRDLTVDTGIDNPGACGIRFIANNQGGVYGVTIVSGDGYGVTGLDLGYTDEQGPCLIRDIRVVGFDIGVHTATGVASETLEHITLESQNRFGFRNDGQPCTVRSLTSTNTVPAFVAGGGLSVLIEADLRNPDPDPDVPAVVCEANLMARDIRTSGYAIAIADRLNGRDLPGPEIAEFLSRPAVSLDGARARGLHLPVQETPPPATRDLRGAASPLAHGADLGAGSDDSAAIQAAIDSGAEVVCLPRGTYDIGNTIELRGNVRLLTGCKAWLRVIEPLAGRDAPVFRFADEPGAAGPPDRVEIEGIHTDFASGPFAFVENTSARTLVMRRLMVNFQGADAYRGTGDGTVFIEDVVGRGFRFTGQTVWARQFNVEGDGTHILNDGGTLWILGYKTEGGGTLIDTRNGGRTEVLGGFSYTVGEHLPEPMFRIEDSDFAATFAEVCFTDKPFDTIVREIRAGTVRDLDKSAPEWRRTFALFSSIRP